MYMRAPNLKTFAHDSLHCLCKILPKCSNGKIYRLSLRKVDEKTRSPNHQPIKFILKAPEEGFICPITQEPLTDPIPDDVLPFDLYHPDRTVIRLACNHDFSAFWLLFNWVHNMNVKCPLCRGGPSGFCLDIVRLPHHVRVPLQMHMGKLKLGSDPKREVSYETMATRRFVDAVAGESFLDLFPEQQEQEYIDRLECKYYFVPEWGDSYQLVSLAKTQYVIALFASWVKCDPVKNMPSWTYLDFNNVSGLVNIGTVMQLLDHVLNVMYGLSLSCKVDRNTVQVVYTVFQSSLRERKNDPF